jgi:hypothetical protein
MAGEESVDWASELVCGLGGEGLGGGESGIELELDDVSERWHERRGRNCWEGRREEPLEVDEVSEVGLDEDAKLTAWREGIAAMRNAIAWLRWERSVRVAKMAERKSLTRAGPSEAGIVASASARNWTMRGHSASVIW